MYKLSGLSKKVFEAVFVKEYKPKMIEVLLPHFLILGILAGIL